MKKLIFLLIFLGLAAEIFAQDWQNDFSQGVQAYQAGNHKEAITKLSKAKQNASDYIGTNNVNYFYITTILARAYEANWQLKEAEKNFLEAYQLAKTLFPQNQEGFLVLVAHNVGKNYYLQQNYPQAEKYTLEAYDFIKNEPQNQDYTAVCHTLGATYKELEKFNEAEKMFLEVKKQTNSEKTLYYDALNGLA
ncbi:MAG: hypothetical protein NZ516_11895, partial [Raineya sp.]|nr:hypothetical protein [Raineya sp.]